MLSGAVGAGEAAVDSIVTRIRSGWSSFRGFMLLLASRGLTLGSKGRFRMHSSVMLYGSETWPVKEDDVIRLERNYVQGWLDGCPLLGQRIGFLKRNLGLD